MTVCPIAIAVGCRKCPIFRLCPVKGIIGDYKPDKSGKRPHSGGTIKDASKKPR